MRGSVPGERTGWRAMTARTSHEVAAVVRVRIPSPLRTYTGAAEVGVAVPLLAPEPRRRSAVCSRHSTLDYPGIRFRMIDEEGKRAAARQAVRGAGRERDLRVRDTAGATLMIVAALSGG